MHNRKPLETGPAPPQSLSSFRWKKRLLSVGVLGIVALLALLAPPRRHRHPSVTVFATRLPSGAFFLAEDPQNPRLQRYLRQEHIDQVVRPYHTDMQKLQALNLWASKLFVDSSPLPNYPPWNALVILDWIRRGKTGGFCAQHAFVFGQACQSLGYSVRYYDLASPESNGGHFTAEAYVPEKKRWLLFEPTWGTYYVDARGTPLGIWEMHAQAVRNDASGVYDYPSGKPVPRDRVSLYYYFRMYLRNNFMSIPVFVTRQGSDMGFEPYRLAWSDSYTGDTIHMADAIPSSDPQDWNFPLDLSRARGTVSCPDKDAFFRLLTEQPPETVIKVEMPRHELLALVREDFVHNPSYHRLRAHPRSWRARLRTFFHHLVA